MKTLASSLVAVVALLATNALADLKLPAVFCDHMVLQRGAAAPVWGWAEPGEEVSVTFAGQTKTAKAGSDGKWMVKLDPMPASAEPRDLTFSANPKSKIQNLKFTDILVGEVWLGSGQSNMAMTVNRARDFEQERAAANLPLVRMFKEESGPADAPQTIGKGQWTVCSPETVGGFSATLYFFGREVHRALDVPVGLINSSVGGTPIESWIDADAQRRTPELKAFFEAQTKTAKEFDAAAAKANYEKQLARWRVAAKEAKAAGKTPPRAPRDPIAVRGRKGNVGGLFNGKIAPLIPYAIRGAVWYQGEANAQPNKAQFYQYHLPLLVKDWRARWGSEFPFAWAQLPNFTRPGEYWMLVREAMLRSLAVPNTGMAITIDIGDPKDIHPKNKQEVGRRLSLWALGTVYKQKVAVTSGPLPAGHKIRGSEVALSFKHTDGGLVAKGGGELKGFQIAGADKAWKPAQAKIAGDRVIVSSADVKQPVAVRYAWEPNPVCNLFNGASLPASPFRTDAWKEGQATP
jgi:sialate O-acetylesterase